MIPDRKWEKIIHATSPYLSDWGIGTTATNVSSVGTNGCSRIIVLDDETVNEVADMGVNNDED